MTEDQLQAVPAFARLPIFEESDDRADGITQPPAGYRGVRECSTLAEVLECLKNSRYVPLGGLKAWVNGGPVVVAYFAEKG